MSGDSAPIAADLSARMARYYQFHARIYDATRWSFLFGRDALRQQVAQLARPQTILEIGCGTGHNLLKLSSTFPEARLWGLDIAEPMLRVARRNLSHLPGRVQLIQGDYSTPLGRDCPFDLIICSYSLSMINPGWSTIIDNAGADLTEGGLMAVVDFHDSALPSFKRWMGVNHVRMDGHLAPMLRARFRPRVDEVRRAYGGIWEYSVFVGQKK